jgi:hypothetical protein
MSPEPVSPDLVKILRALMSMEELSTFSLGGGTSLALRFEHRSSLDIDLFSTERFDSESLMNGLRRRFGEIEIFNRTVGSLCLAIRGVKVDVLHSAVDELQMPTTLNGIRFISLDDIAAMKINAVTNRGSKKDFSDLLLLHQNGVELSMALDFFCQKYGSSGRFLAIRSLQFFEDARNEPDPTYLNDWSWDFVEKEMSSIVSSMT